MHEVGERDREHDDREQHQEAGRREQGDADAAGLDRDPQLGLQRARSRSGSGVEMSRLASTTSLPIVGSSVSTGSRCDMAGDFPSRTSDVASNPIVTPARCCRLRRPRIRAAASPAISDASSTAVLACSRSDAGERQVADQQRDGEADAATTATPTRSRHASPSLSSARVNRVTSQVPAEDPDRLAQHQTEHDAEHDRFGSRRPAGELDPGAQQREERHRDHRADRRDPVLERSAGERASSVVGQHPGEQAERRRRRWSRARRSRASSAQATTASGHVGAGGCAPGSAGGRRTPRSAARGRRSRPVRWIGRGVEDGDHHDHDQVVDHREGEQERAQRGRQRRADDGQDGQGEGDVGRGRAPPSRRGCRCRG